jgi:DmsE family decaheme c-type cytochrome
MHDTHQSNGVGCTSCHSIHAQQDAVLEPATQSQVCVSCHNDIRHDLHKISRHPMENAGVTCTSCHAAHGSLQEKMIKRMTVNQTCYQCHADKRGPFLWEHAPVRENCLDCHAAHGSNQKGILKTRSPFLCQQCHSMAVHPSLSLNPNGLQTGAMNNRFLLLKGCVNCHSAVHGSNHPSGVKLQR